MTLTKPLVSAKRCVICNTGAAGKVVGCGMAFGVFRSWPRGGVSAGPTWVLGRIQKRTRVKHGALAHYYFTLLFHPER